MDREEIAMLGKTTKDPALVPLGRSPSSRNRMLFVAIAVWVAAILLRAGDPSWSQFKPEKYGIGAALVQSDSTAPVVIRGCSPGGPADRAGLQRDDRVLALDDHSVLGWKLKDVVKYIS